MGRIGRDMVRGGATDPDDLLQGAVVSLMRKADQYDPARGAVTTFAGLYCWAARRDAARRRRHRPDSDPDRRIPLDTSRLREPAATAGRARRDHRRWSARPRPGDLNPVGRGLGRIGFVRQNAPTAPKIDVDAGGEVGPRPARERSQYPIG